jgi:putative ABC transport system substrate-binding protein
MEPTYVARLREGLKVYGYVEDRNLKLLVTFTGGNVERARGGENLRRSRRRRDRRHGDAGRHHRQAGDRDEEDPIVMTPVADPIATGFAAGIAQPGGYLTGMSMVGPGRTCRASAWASCARSCRT